MNYTLLQTFKVFIIISIISITSYFYYNTYKIEASAAPLIQEPTQGNTHSDNAFSLPSSFHKKDEVNNITPGYVHQVMEVCGNKLSDTRKKILAAQIARITSENMVRRDWQEAFVGLICIESKYDANAKSSVGAVGLSQVMPKYAGEFAKACNLGSLSIVDLSDSEVNLTIGACQFRRLLEALDGNIALALAGYNSGQESETTKRLAKLADGNAETMGYVAKFYTLTQKLQNSIQENELPPSRKERKSNKNAIQKINKTN